MGRGGRPLAEPGRPLGWSRRACWPQAGQSVFNEGVFLPALLTSASSFMRIVLDSCKDEEQEGQEVLEVLVGANQEVVGARQEQLGHLG